MGWFKKVIKRVIKKQASQQEDIKNIALEQLQGGISPKSVAMRFIMQIGNIDPNFARSGGVKAIMDASSDPSSLSSAISNYGAGITPVPSNIPVNIPPQKPTISNPTEEAITDPIDDVSSDDSYSDTDDETDSSETDLDDTEPKETVSDDGIIGVENVLTQQLNTAPNFNDRISSDPTLLQSFEIPVSAIPQMTKKLNLINKKLKNMYHPEIKIEFSGNSYNKPIQYQNRVVQEPYVQVKISGTLPSATEEIAIRIKEPVLNRRGNPVYEEDGKTPKTKKVGEEPKGVKLIAKVHHHPLSEEEQQKYLQNERPESSLRQVIENCQSQGITPYFNQVEPLEKGYPIDGKFWYSSPKECFSCKVRHARVSTYIGAVVAPENMVDKTREVIGEDGVKRQTVLTRRIDVNRGKKGMEPSYQDVPIKVIKDEDVEQAPQEQFGGSCIDPFDAVKTITDLKNWVKNYKEAGDKDKKKKERKNYKGGSRGSLPTEALFATTVNMLRDPKYQGRVSLMSLGRAADSYVYKMKREQEQNQNQIDNRQPSYNYKIKNAPNITDYDREVGAMAASWWREKLGSLNPEDDQNKVTISIVPTISIVNKPGLKNLRNVVDMVQTYLTANDIELDPFETESQETPQEALTSKPVSEEETILTPESIPETGDKGVLDNLPDVKEGFNFISKLKYKSSSEWRTKRGYSHYFVDDKGNKYVIFDKYQKDPRTNRINKNPSLQFTKEQDYYIRGEKGKTNTQYKTTILDNAIVVPMDRLQEYSGNTTSKVPDEEYSEIPESIVPEVTTPETTTPETTTPEATTPAAIEEIKAPEITEIPPKRIGTITELTNRAKRVVETGLTNNGDPMTPSQLIPLYVKQLMQHNKNIKEQSWINTLNKALQRGNNYFLRYLDTIPAYLEK